jgi:hypothetical protein
MSLTEMLLRMNACVMPNKGGYVVTADLPKAGMAIVHCERNSASLCAAVRECYARWMRAQKGAVS